VKQNTYHVNRLRRNLVLKLSGPISWFSSKKISLLLLLLLLPLNLAVQNRLAQVTG
jgi:hypothetical protein